MERDWSRLGEALKTARRRAGITQEELADALGVGRSTVQKIERGHEYAKVQQVHRAAAREVGWTEDSIDIVLGGGEPSQGQSTPGPEALPDGLGELPLRVLQAIGAGRLIDSMVINLSPNDPESTATLVLRGNQPAMSTEQMREVMRKWSELQRAANRIYGDEEST